MTTALSKLTAGFLEGIANYAYVYLWVIGGDLTRRHRL
jgi:hypothetical protein